MGLYSKPPTTWDGDEVCTWLATLNLTQLVPAFQINHVRGPDLFSLTMDDLTGSSFSCTPFQANKVLAEVSKLRDGTAGSGPTAANPNSAKGTSYPDSPFSGQAAQSAQQSMPPTPSLQSMQPTPASSAALPASVAGSSEVERLRLELEKEKQRNSQQEMDMKARLAAAEAQRTASAPVVVNNSGAMPPAYSAPPTIVYPSVTRENYCGPISWIIGLLIFPCICFCPIDERPVYGPMVTAPSGVVYPAPPPQ